MRNPILLLAAVAALTSPAAAEPIVTCQFSTYISKDSNGEQKLLRPIKTSYHSDGTVRGDNNNIVATGVQMLRNDKGQKRVDYSVTAPGVGKMDVVIVWGKGSGALILGSGYDTSVAMGKCQ
jgi:hypothetical protein